MGQPTRAPKAAEIVDARDKAVLRTLRSVVRPLTEGDLMVEMNVPDTDATRETLRNVLTRLRVRGQAQEHPDGRWERL